MEECFGVNVRPVWRVDCNLKESVQGFPFFMTLGGVLTPVLQLQRVFPPSKNSEGVFLFSVCFFIC